MKLLRHACAVVAACAAMLAPGAVQAQQRIGATTVVQNDVSRVSGAQRDRLATGEAVFRNEAVQTGADSLAKIVFVDQTNLSIGPNARVSLNQYVYSDERPTGKVALNLLKGTYRFVTGDLEKRAYQVNTPVATIGVRGTVFDVSTTGTRTVVTLLSGAVLICTRSATPRVCLTLDQSGQVAVVTATGATIAPSGSETRFAFAGYCGSNPALCTPTRLADNSTVPQPTSFASLCGR